MIVMKFGGSALQTPKKVRSIAQIVRSHIEKRPVLVLSAMGTTTDDLLAAARAQNRFSSIEKFHRELLNQLALPKNLLNPILDELSTFLNHCSELTPPLHDRLLSFGERLSVRLFAAFLNAQGIAAAHLDGWDAGLLSTSDHTRAAILPETYERVPIALQPLGQAIPVITGFIAKDRMGTITTLGRGGSDLSASVIGKALKASEVQLWKDVNGILTADPRLVSEAQPISRLSFLEAGLLARFGAKILHPASIVPAMSAQIPVRVKNYQDPDYPGTLIQGEERSDGVVAISHLSHRALVHISPTSALEPLDFLASVFLILRGVALCADVIEASQDRISLLLEEGGALLTLQERLQRSATIEVEPNKSYVSLIGKSDPSRVLRVLSEEGICFLRFFASSMIINDEDCQRCVNALHRQFCVEGALV